LSDNTIRWESSNRKEQVKKEQELPPLKMLERGEENPGICRRRFLRFLAGLGAAAQCLEAEASTARKGKFFWVDLRTGQLGFPSGFSIPAGMPGSIMKLITSAALVDARLLSPNQRFECRGVYRLNNETYKCLYPHGIIDMVHAVGLSCNIYFAQASRKLSARMVLDYAARFGFDRAVAQFGSGHFPEQPGPQSSSYALGLADDLQPQALQIMRLSALIATRGKLPYLHSADDELVAGAAPFELALSETCWQVLTQGMRIAGRQGTGKRLDREDKLHLAIKTGTAPHGKSFQSWITGYFPFEAPHYAFVLRAQAGTSQDEAVPQARPYLFGQQWP
jgi:cell division protein FtsI/penicillin-binding protein 2